MAYEGVEEFFENDVEHRAKLARTVNGLLLGRINSVYEITLTADATSTVLTRADIGPDAVAILTPQTSSAASAAASVWVTVSKGALTIHHDSNSATDRTFGVAILG